MINTLEIDSVLKSFGERKVLTDIYLKCQTGNIIGLLGRNGSGKSTLLKILFGIIPADECFIKINDRPLKYPFQTRGSIGYLPQDGYLLSYITVEKAASMYIDAKSIGSFFDDKVINPFRKNKINTLSGGELRYLEIKLLLYADYKFILLDEPFNGLSPVMIDMVKKMITRSAVTKGIILTDHDHANVTSIATKQYLLYDGGLKDAASIDELIRWGYVPEEKK